MMNSWTGPSSSASTTTNSNSNSNSNSSNPTKEVTTPSCTTPSPSLSPSTSTSRTTTTTASSTTTAAAAAANTTAAAADNTPYAALVVDSGPIIKHTGITNLFGKAQMYYTVPAVLDEIRDAKARHHLQQWPMELVVKEPSMEAMQRVSEFSKLTGDYPSLSAVDLQVLALVVDLEHQHVGSLMHLRTTPKRTIGLGKLQQLKKEKEQEQEQEKEKTTNSSSNSSNSPEEEKDSEPKEPQEEELDYDIVVENDDEDDSEEEEGPVHQDPAVTTTTTTNPSLATASASASAAPKSWASLVHPTQGSTLVHVDLKAPATPSMLAVATNHLARVSLSTGDQVEDADDHVDAAAATTNTELDSHFPSLSATATVPYEGSDNDDDNNDDDDDNNTNDDNNVNNNNNVKHEDADTHTHTHTDVAQTQQLQAEEAERELQKKQALQPVSKSGKTYNSFRKYGRLMKPKPTMTTNNNNNITTSTSKSTAIMNIAKDDDGTNPALDPSQSHILGGTAMGAEGMKAEDDDGEGWITSTKDITTLKTHSGGHLDPMKGMHGDLTPIAPTASGPSKEQRTACTTTDFAMQNVLLQMGLPLLSVDGMQIRRLKSWVLRCGACFKIHTEPMDPTTGLRRLFCSHCGSDMMQRISASVDGKTGRLKLHLSKRYQHNLRGTKFSLPKAGSGNRFQGDLLLREDQLKMGAWNQKVKKNGGGQSRAHAQSIFGKDIASNVGCVTTAVPNDITVGFGRRNPNASKGRERRGKKKKSSDRACGLRRY